MWFLMILNYYFEWSDDNNLFLYVVYSLYVVCTYFGARDIKIIGTNEHQFIIKILQKIVNSKWVCIMTSQQGQLFAKCSHVWGQN